MTVTSSVALTLNDVLFLNQFAVRDGFERYGAAACFEVGGDGEVYEYLSTDRASPNGVRQSGRGRFGLRRDRFGGFAIARAALRSISYASTFERGSPDPSTADALYVWRNVSQSRFE